MQEHIAYYKQLVADDPQNIDAHLRLGAIWRQAGHVDEAVRAYNTAARLLARGGLDLEAIAACRAVFELDPSHLETKLFLAQLYARSPAGKEDGRVANAIAPVEPEQELVVLMAEDAISEPAYEEYEYVDLDDDVSSEEEVLSEDVMGSYDEGEGEIPTVKRPVLSRPTAAVGEASELDGGVEWNFEDHQASFGEIEDLVMDSIQIAMDSIDYEGHFQEADDPISLDGVAIPRTPIFSHLPAATFMTLSKHMEMRRVDEGESIISVKANHRALFIILSGEVRVDRPTPEGTKFLATMTRGAFFGEFELLTGQSPKVDVVAETAVALLVIPHSLIAAIAEKDPTIWQVLWNFYHERLLNNLLATSSIFGSLTGSERIRLANEFNRVEVPSGKRIIRQGQPSEGLYLIARGEVEVRHDHDDRVNIVATLREGDFFGTVSSVTRSPVMATVNATQETTLLFLRRSRLSSLTKGKPEIEKALRRLVAYRQVIVGKTGYDGVTNT